MRFTHRFFRNDFMPRIANISTYKFAELHDLPTLRERLRGQSLASELKGTILLSPEGINLFIAGELPAVEAMIETIRAIPGLEDLAPKWSESEEQPFNRMLVKIKKEIIAFGVEGINPARYTSPRISARELKQWLDEGRPVTLLDTRNDYEVKMGTFTGAKILHLDHFKEFPEAVKKLPESMKEVPMVSFCTGGVRCEKAAPLLEREGFRTVYQLDGGILKYFEECGGAHYEGECFVFDKRVGVDPALQETGSQLCFACQEPLKAEELLDPRYVYEVSCPYCFEQRVSATA